MFNPFFVVIVTNLDAMSLGANSIDEIGEVQLSDEIATNKMCCAADMMLGAANTMRGVATVMHVRWVGWWVGQNQSLTPPYINK